MNEYSYFLCCTSQAYVKGTWSQNRVRLAFFDSLKWVGNRLLLLVAIEMQGLMLQQAAGCAGGDGWLVLFVLGWGRLR